MEEMAKLGDLALKLERYRYNLIASLGWVIFGMLFASAIMIFNGLIMLLGFNPWYIAVSLISAGVLGGLTYRFFKKFMPKSERKEWKAGLIFLFLPFVVAYSVIPKLLTFTGLQESLYYSLIWYPSLGVGLLLFGLFTESKDEWLVANTSTHAGISMILSSLAFIPLASLVTDYYGVMALSLIASSIMLLVYLGAFLFSFFKASKSI